MNWDDFWISQGKKNETGRAKYCITTDPETSEQEFMMAWIVRWHAHFAYFTNVGCGCCINIYEFDVPVEAIAEIPQDWVADAGSGMPLTEKQRVTQG